jgi:hypothetical protein
MIERKVKPMNKLITLLFYLTFYLFLTQCGLSGDSRYKGTNVGVMNCVKKNTPDNAGLDEKKIKELCIKKHEKRFKTSPINFIGARYSFTFGLIYFEVTLENKSKDKIITGFDIWVMHEDNKDNNGKQIDENIKFDNLWILPGEEKNVSNHTLKFIPNTDRFNYLGKVDNRKLLWSVREGDSYKGVKVILK